MFGDEVGEPFLQDDDVAAVSMFDKPTQAPLAGGDEYEFAIADMRARSTPSRC